MLEVVVCSQLTVSTDNDTESKVERRVIKDVSISGSFEGRRKARDCAVSTGGGSEWTSIDSTNDSQYTDALAVPTMYVLWTARNQCRWIYSERQGRGTGQGKVKGKGKIISRWMYR